MKIKDHADFIRVYQEGYGPISFATGQMQSIVVRIGNATEAGAMTEAAFWLTRAQALRLAEDLLKKARRCP